MAKKIFDIIFSNKLTLILLIAFAISMAYGTFLENDFGRNTAAKLIYNSSWFELIIFMLMINFIGNIFKYKLFRVKKMSILMFHLAFIIIIIGAGITRYFGINGVMHIREGSSSDSFISESTFINVKIDNNKIQRVFKLPLALSSKDFFFEREYNFLDENVKLECVEYIPNAEESIEQTNGKGETIIHIVHTTDNGRKNFYIKKGQTKLIQNIPLGFDKEVAQGINILTDQDGNILLNTDIDMSKFRMRNQEKSLLKKNQNHKLEKLCLYSYNQVSFVVKEIYKNAKSKFVESENKSNPI